MTDGPARRLTISVPPDVAETLAEQPNASAYVTETIRARKRLDALRAEFAAMGIQVTEQGLANARARRAAVEAEWTKERREASRNKARTAMLAELAAADPATETPAA
jgi:hypothetical protein